MNKIGKNTILDRYGFIFTKKKGFHTVMILTTTSVNILIWLSLNFRSDFFMEATFTDHLMNLLQIFLETVFLTEATILYCHWAIWHFFRKGYSQSSMVKYIVTLVLFVLAVSCLMATFYRLLYPDSDTVFLETLFSDVLSTTVIASLLFSNALIINLREVEGKMRKAELDRLALQTDPHFIFNRFSTLSELIYIDPTEAERYMNRLTGLYRYMLRNRNRHLAHISDEVRSVEMFMDLLRPEPGEVSLVIGDGIRRLDGHLPTMSLQTLVENAMKHNAHSSARPLSITIGSDGEYVTVRNNIIPLLDPVPSEKIGLKNLDAFYDFYCNKHIEVESAQGTFSVRIPIIYEEDIQ